VVAGGNAAPGLGASNRIVDEQVRAAQTNSIDLPIKKSPWRVPCRVKREPNA
jgi:hypothetical protein